MVVKGTSCIINPKLMLLAVILLSLMCSLSHVHGEEIMVVDKAFNGREVKVRAGTMIKVEWGNTMLLGEIIYCSAEGSEFAVGLELEDALYETDSLAALAETWAEPTP